MVGVHTHAVRLQVECELAVLDLLELVLVQIGPAPDPGVDNMRKPFSAGNLQPPVCTPAITSLPPLYSDFSSLGLVISAQCQGGLIRNVCYVVCVVQ